MQHAETSVHRNIFANQLQVNAQTTHEATFEMLLMAWNQNFNMLNILLRIPCYPCKLPSDFTQYSLLISRIHEHTYNDEMIISIEGKLQS